MENQKTLEQLEIERIFNKFYAKLERIAKDLDIDYTQLFDKGLNNTIENHYEKITEIVCSRSPRRS